MIYSKDTNYFENDIYGKPIYFKVFTDSQDDKEQNPFTLMFFNGSPALWVSIDFWQDKVKI